MPTLSIPLSLGKFMLIDSEDEALVTAIPWRAHRAAAERFYASCLQRDDAGVQRRVYLHRLILGSGPQDRVDHINLDTLDNRRENLRPCTDFQNRGNTALSSNNTSGYKGVHWHKGTCKWRAYIKYGGRQHSLGLYFDPEDAARAYDVAAIQVFGEFARINFPEVSEESCRIRTPDDRPAR